MANPFFSGRIPQELYEKAETYCKESGESKTDLLIKALASYLDCPIEFPKKNNFIDQQVTKEEFEELTGRVKILEDLLNTKIDVIESDNKEITNSTPEEKNDNREITPDNSEKTEEKNADNSFDNIVIRTQDLSDVEKIQPQQKTNLKNQAFNKALKMGYEISENIRFIPPIEIVYKKGIFVEGKEYKLFCEGTNENAKPIWLLKPYDNNSYQLSITE